MFNIIVSPYEIDSNAEKSTKKIVKYLKKEKVDYSIYFCTNLEDVPAHTQEVMSQGENEFVVVGDDRLIHKFINSFKDLSKIKLGIVPTSKHDDFANYLGLNTNPILAMKDILSKNIKPVDVLVVNDSLVIDMLVIGASAEIFEIYNQYKLQFPLLEKITTKKYSTKYEGVELSLEMDDKKAKNEHIFELIVANGGFSKGKNLSPLSNVSDGMFNLIYSTTPTKEFKKKILKSYEIGTHIYNETTHQKWLTNLKIKNADNHIKALVDGEIVNFEELNISLIEQGLKLFRKP